MVADIVDVFLDAIESMFQGVADTLVSLFDTLIYVPGAEGGLTGIATYSLVFGGIALALGFINKFTLK
jgi:hypothetical protein